ncbi:hypothetical protein OCK74_03545 [Chitinophagaceae bacterium LB-8]|uniref:Uncharacterized protein n=1 Tax=Paraflavisolibacter caeni TaxID=2982496 RepID=A0A9X3BF34_9BACT|nr:DUF6617 family protein [Paraflavisolibacter caeni]MCU7548169.1 hypothetical protein [Paraflavisolibacter caeni]
MRLYYVLKLYDQILYGVLNPWTKDSNSAVKYQHLLHELTLETFHVRPIFDMNFLKPVGPKRQYYAAIIEHEFRSILSDFDREMGAANSEDERTFLATKVLKNVDQHLRRTAFIINSKGYKSDIILPPSYFRHTTECDTADATYILQLMKFQLIRLYLELQERYAPYIDMEVFCEEDIHQHYFGETAPERSFIVKVCSTSIHPVQTTYVPSTEKVFQPRMYDVRPPVPGVLSYEKIVANQERFARLERVLFEHHLIDHDYEFQRKPMGNYLRMAAIYLVAFQKGYFQKYYFINGRRYTLTAKDVLKFFNRRYNIHIDKQFRTLSKKGALSRFLENNQNNLWISLIDKL